MKQKLLRPASRLFWVAINLCLGILPSLAFFLWIERNASLPLVGGERLYPSFLSSSFLATSFPEFSDFTLNWISFGWDTALILLFGFIHSMTAQPFFLKRVESLFPIQAQRTVYLTITGMTALGVMGLWQSTGLVLWNLALSPVLLQALSMLFFWSFLAVGATIFRSRAGKGIHLWSFLGLKPLYSTAEQIQNEEARQELLLDGLYRYVRHPIYTFALFALWLTPLMTLDRAAIAVGVSLYLTWGIPLEEKKLLARFGDRYRDFQSRVPALFPRSFRA